MKNKLYLLSLCLILQGLVFAQVPNISYPSSQNYVKGVTIAPLLPINSGGSVTSFALVTTIAGNNSIDGTGTEASFYMPYSSTVDVLGNVYVADTNNHKIRMITSAGVVTTIAGGGVGFADGKGTMASFSSPSGIALDASGTIYVADSGNNKIRKITPAGVVTTFAGNGATGGADGISTVASFNNPSGIVVDGSGNVYVGDRNNHKIRKINSSGVVTTLAGNGSQGSTNGTGTAASFSYPRGVALDASGNLYVADQFSNKIRKITPAGSVSTFAGSGVQGSTDGMSSVASFGEPNGVAVDGFGNVYVAESRYNKIRMITQAGVVTTFAGSGTNGFVNGTGAASSFAYPMGVATDSSGNVYVADTSNNKIRKITPTGLVTTFAGNGSSSGSSANGIGTAASFSYPSSVAIDASGTIYIADSYSNKIRKMTAGGLVSTLAGTGEPGAADGSRLEATFNSPQGVTVDSSGNVYVADSNNNKIRKISPAGIVSTVAGSGAFGSTDGIGAAASFYSPQGLTTDSMGNIYIADTSNNKIRKISADGVVTTLAGNGSWGWADGAGASASFNQPSGIVVDSYGTIYVAEGDKSGSRIRKITVDGVVSTLAGNGSAGSTEGIGTAASFSYPRGITLDTSGNVYVADTFNNKIRKISITGIVSTVAGSLEAGYNDSIDTAAHFNQPKGIAVDISGNIYIADTGNDKIRKISQAGGFAISPELPVGLSFDSSTGAISGMPTAASSQTNYIVTATNSQGTSTATVAISVGDKPVINYSTPQTFATGTAITYLQPTSTGGAVTSYSIFPSLPTGLSLNTTSGVISGIPTVTTSQISYTITALNSYGTGTATIVITIDSGSNAPADVPANGLLAYYPFNGNANDESGNGRNGTVRGAVLSSDRFGNANSAYTFSDSSLIEILDSALLDFSINDFTISAWVNYNPNPNPNPNSYPINYNYILSKGTSAFLVFQNGVGFDTYGKGYEASSNPGLTAGSWFHVVCVKNNSGYTYYINNNPSIRGFGEYNIPRSDTLNNLTIGKGIYDSFRGVLDDIAIWNRALTQEEITNLYSSKYNNPYTLIPDVNFEKKLIALGIDSGTADGKVLTANISTLTSLNVSSSSITNLTGIEDFSGLTNLNCSYNQLTNLDISKNVSLLSLNCSYNRLSNLDVTKNSALTDLNCSSNQLTNFDVTKNVAIKKLNCHYNRLTNLDVTKNIALTDLICSYNQIVTLDVSKNLALSTFYCYSNQIASLDLSKNVSLGSLSCSGNLLASLDLSKNVSLGSLSCSGNLLASLDLSKNVSLAYLNCSGNQLVSLDLSKNIALTDLSCSYNQLTSLDLSKVALTYLDCDSNRLTALNLKNGKNILLSMKYGFVNNPNLSCIQVDDVAYSNANWASYKDVTASYSTDCTPYTLIPDINFENKLISLGIDSGVPDGKVPTANVDKLTSLDVSNSQIADLTGIQDFVALETLNCGLNKLTTLDVSKNLLLVQLECFENQLTALNLSQNTALTYLDCFTNQLTNLDLSKNVALKTVYCYDNQLTSLDVSKNTALTVLDCAENKISSLDLSQNVALEEIACFYNKLTNLDITKNAALTYFKCNNNLLSNLNLKNGKNTLLNNSKIDFKGNPGLTCIQVDNVTYSNTNWSTLKDAAASFSTDCSVPYTLIPDVNFEKKLIALGIDSGTADGTVLTSSISSLTSLDVSSSSITDLTGIQDFVALSTLYCHSNQLITLDLSKNIFLTQLSCSANQLTAVDISKNVSLQLLYCNNNQLETLDVSKNLVLIDLECSYNKLVSLDVSKNSSLFRLTCQFNQLTSLDISTNIELNTVNCSLNQLTTLDISKNIALTYYFNCSDNQLVSLNLKNGQNRLSKSHMFTFTNNPNLTCIQVDDVAYSNTNWANNKDATASYSTDCSTSNLYTYIPDINFENKLIFLGIDSGVPDGKVPTANVDKITSLDVSNSQIADLTGIQDFSALTNLNCSNNQLANLDVTKNVALKILNCHYNRLTNLDVTKNSVLVDLFCSYNQLVTLDVSKNVALSTLYCYYNQLTSLDLSQNLALSTLHCIENQLTTLDVSNNLVLGMLWCTSNRLTVLDVSKNNSLYYLKCDSNQLESLNLKNGKNTILSNDKGSNFTNNPSLNCIQVDDVAYSNANWSMLKDATASYSTDCAPYTLIPDVNFENKLIALGIDSGVPDGRVLTANVDKITSLDVSKSSIVDLTGIQDFSALETLNCSGSGIITSSGGDGALKIIDISKNTKLITLNCSSNKVVSLDVSSNLLLKNLNCGGNILTSLDVSKNVDLNTLSCYSNKLTSLDVTKNTALTSLFCSSNQLFNMDISNNLALITLNCNFNYLTSFDTSKNLALKNLDCGSNRLTSLDTSYNLALTSLFCFTNQLTSLDVSKNTLLTALHCSNNKLASLDVSRNVSLTAFTCSMNQIASLDVSKNISLTTLYLDLNHLTNFDISKNTALINFDCSENKLTSLNLKNGTNINFSKGNIRLISNPNLSCIQVDDASYSNNNWAEAKDSTASFSTDCAPFTLIPDVNFENRLISLGIDSGVPDGKVPTANIASLTSLDVSNSQIADLTGIQDFEALETLICNGRGRSWSITTGGDGMLKTLDISKNTKLITLNCSSNQLKSLDISSNTLLNNLNCSGNAISSLDVSKNTALNSLSCHYNKLTSLDFTKNIALTSLFCNNNQISSLNFANITTLTTIECYSNRLTSLDVSKNTALVSLNCSANQLTSFDLSKNVSLASLDCGFNQLKSLDLSKNVSLASLSCSSNQLSNLDVTKNLALCYLVCSSNQLASLDLLRNVSLVSLYCSSNQLASLDLSKTVSLTSLDCSSNQLASLDLSKNVLLTSLACSHNQLSILDVSKNVALSYINCSSNGLTSLNLKNGKNRLLSAKSIFIDNPNLSCIQVDDVAYSNANWFTNKDATASFNDNCFSLPTDNFAVESKGESCLGENNGEINITAKTTNVYVASINGTSYPFANNSLKVGSLVPGIYTISINVSGETFEQSFKVTIPKGATITGKSSIASNKVNVEITEGTAPYTVFVDGVEQFETTASRFSVETQKGGLIEVKTAKACEGIYAEDIAGIEGAVVAYPNPTSGNFEIEMPTSRDKVAIGLYTLNGTLISNNTYTIENGKAKLTLENQASGVYIAKIELGTSIYLRIIKK